MSAVAVLKFGSSVLAGVRDLDRAVAEIYRERRQGRGVVAVVSALGATTARLLGLAERVAPGSRGEAAALLVSTGELRAVGLLALALERAGVPCAPFDTARLGLRVRAAGFDGEPLGFDVESVRRALAECGVVVLPGFVARDGLGRTALLGRGGSDLTALLVAHALGAEVCRLVKDVDGVYERDPSRAPAGARRFAALGFAAARATGGRIVQAKALAWAAAHGREFDVSACDRAAHTRVGAAASRLLAAEREPHPLRVGLLGLGTVGMGVARALAQRPERLQLARVLVRDRRRLREPDAPLELLCEQGADVLASDIDVLVELLGGLEPALGLVRSALLRGISVVTANKLLLARHGAELERLARLHGARLCDAGSVGGALPVLERVRALALSPGLREVRGVLNGTSNFVLERLAEGDSLAQAVCAARTQGLAESDPARDLDGSDTADKLVLIARAGFRDCRPRWLERRGIDGFDPARAHAVRAGGRSVRLVGRCLRSGDEVQLSVGPRELSPDDELWELAGARNRVLLCARDGSRERLDGLGAGRAPTTLAVLADLLELARERECAATPTRAEA